jgi:hypothetical protein
MGDETVEAVALATVEPMALPRPLGVRADAPLTAAQERTLRSLEGFDLGPVRERLLRDGTLPSGWVDEALFEFRRYLGLRVLCARTPMMLSKPIDAVWHTCILFTRLYTDYCQQAFGEYVHHDPTTEQIVDRAALWAEFEAAYTAWYGTPGRLWLMGRPAVP